MVETPGHAPSHVSLHLPERRLLIAGDVVLGRVALYFDYGWTPDPVGELLASLDRVERLDARLALAGHGRPFGDLPMRVEAQRAFVRTRLHTLRAMIADRPARRPTRSAPAVRDAWTPATVPYFFAKMLCVPVAISNCAEKPSGCPGLAGSVGGAVSEPFVQTKFAPPRSATELLLVRHAQSAPLGLDSAELNADGYADPALTDRRA